MSEWLGNIEFVNPWWLYALLLLPLLVFWHLYKIRKQQVYMRVSSTDPIKDLRSNRSVLYPYLPILSLLAVGSLIFGLARPQLTLTEEEVKADGIDIVIAMDVSSSMLAQDFKPDRLSVSKAVAKSFVDKRTYDRIGLVVFAAESYTQCPLTTDHRVVKDFLDGLQCGILEDGTAIGMGLASAVNRMKDSEAKSKVVILLTDGVNNSGYIKPMTSVEIAKELGTKVYTIGVGTRGRALMPQQRRGNGEYLYRMVNVNIDEELLRTIADDTGGKYYRAIDEESLQAIYTEIDALEKTEINVTTFKRYSEEFRPFLIFAMIVFFLEVLLRMTVFRTIP